MRIQIPDTVKNIDELNDWLSRADSDKGAILPHTKRTGQYCFGFTFNDHTQKVEYLINDGVSVGRCKFENLNKYLYFVA